MANYRPVSLTAIGFKVMEHILHSKIMEHLEEHSILTSAQHGYRIKRSCKIQLIATIHELTSGLSDGHQVDSILLDFAKAFYKVPLNRLLDKLQFYGVSDFTFKYVESFQNRKKQHVLVVETISEESEAVSGVPQGTVTGPLLFPVFLNYRQNSVNSSVKLSMTACCIILFDPLAIRSSCKTTQIHLKNREVI